MSFLVGNNKGHLASQDSPDKADSNLIEDKIGMHLAVTARSRFPRRWFDYIAEQHKYRPNYLNPEGWVLELNAAPRPEQEALAMAKADRFSQIPGGAFLFEPGFGPEFPDPEPPPPPIPPVDIPDDAEAYEWTITQLGLGNDFQQRVTREIRRPEGSIEGTPWKAMVSVPAPGWYRIHVKMVRSHHADPEAEVSYLLRNFLVVSIGDSYASGEGVPDRPGNPHGFDPGWSLWDLIPEHAVLTLLNEIVEEVKDWLKLKFTTLTQVAEGTLEMDTEPTWLEKEAHRSLNSGPALAARLLEDLQQGDVVSFLSFARSGAEVWKGLLEPRRSGDLWAGGLGQLDELQQELGDHHIDALLISVGGNDIGFSGRLADLVGKDSPSIWMLLLTELSSLVVDESDENRERVRDMIEEALLELDRALVDLADAVEVLNVGQVYLTEYPMAMFDQVRNGKVEVGSGCEIFSSLMFNADIDSKDAKLIKGMGQSLNDKLKAFCDDKPGWFYVDGIAEGFAGHGYCIGDESFYVRAEESFAIQGDGKGTMHPNAGGLAVYARRIAGMVREHTIETRPVFDENGKPIDTSQFESGVFES